jgi:hypothetical protein
MNLCWVWVSGWVAVLGSCRHDLAFGSRVLTVDLPSRLALWAGWPPARVYETEPWPGTVLQSWVWVAVSGSMAAVTITVWRLVLGC